MYVANSPLSYLPKNQITTRKGELSPAVSKWITHVKVIIIAVTVLYVKAVPYEHRNEMGDLEFIWGFYETFLNFILHACKIMN